MDRFRPTTQILRIDGGIFPQTLHWLRRFSVVVLGGPSMVGPCVAGRMIGNFLGSQPANYQVQRLASILHIN